MIDAFLDVADRFQIFIELPLVAIANLLAKVFRIRKDRVQHALIAPAGRVLEQPVKGEGGI